MRFNGLRWLLLLAVSISAAPGADNDKARFEAKPAASYPHHQTSEKVTIAAEPMESDEQTHEAFGKVNPYRYGVLPVLLVIQNDSPDAIKVDRIKLLYELPDGSKVEATPSPDVKFLSGTRQPHGVPGVPLGIPIKRAPKNPLAEWEIEGRAFLAKVIPAGQSASGFVYFQVPQSSAAASVYISGLADPVNGKELYFFEIPMSGK
ncbi:MAG TPA: hypothetical protein VGL82_02640 [Bryobacteraceae bacterium]